MEVVWVHVVVVELAMVFVMMDYAAASMGSVVRVSSIALVCTRSWTLMRKPRLKKYVTALHCPRG
jgi:hypothetical protein